MPSYDRIVGIVRIYELAVVNRIRATLGRLMCIAGIVAVCGVASGQTSVLTSRYNNFRTGTNLEEKVLTVKNVKSNFGRLYSLNVGDVRAQPLVIANVAVGGKQRNLLLVCSGVSKVYGFDADDGTTTPLWTRTLPKYTPPDLPNTNGATLLATPVVDPVTNTIYFTTRNFGGSGLVHSNCYYTLYAISANTGLDVLPPVTISGSVPAGGTATLDFDPFQHVQRAAVTLSNGKLYIAFAGFADVQPFHGWIFVYDAATLNKLAVYCTTPQGFMGGVWQGAQGLVTDEQGNIFFETGNGEVDFTKKSYGMSILKMDPTTLQVVDSFTPYNWKTLNRYDLDLACGGPMHIPGTNVLVGVGKEGKLYLLDTNNLGGNRLNDDNQTLQAIQACEAHIHGTPVYYDGPTGKFLYVWSEEDYLKAFSVVNNRLVVPVAMKSAKPAPHGMPGGYLSLSADGKTPGTAVLWALVPWVGSTVFTNPLAVLRAYDPTTMTEIWNSEMNMVDDMQKLSRFVMPVVANGKVYAASSSGGVNVYGILSSILPTNPSATAKAGPGVNYVFWPLVANAKNYRVTRGTAATGAFTEVQNSALNSFRDEKVVAGTYYYYRVSSINDAGESATYWSGKVQAIAPVSSAQSTAKALKNAVIRNGADSGTAVTVGSTLTVSHTGAKESQVLAMVDVSSIPLSASKVLLRLYGSATGDLPVTAFSLGAEFSGATTWNSRPANTGDIGTLTIGTQAKWYEWDITALVKNAIRNGYDNCSVGLRTDSDADFSASFQSLKSANVNAPQAAVWSAAVNFSYPTFTGTGGLLIKGDSSVANGALLLNNNGFSKATTVLSAIPTGVGAFDTTFEFVAGTANDEGFTFVVTPSTTDIGDTGKELGYGPDANYGNRVTNGVAVKFDFKDNLGEGANTIAIVAKGRSMTGPGTNLTSKSINFTSGDVFRVRIVNSGTSLSVSIRDKKTLAGTRLVANYNLYSIAAAADGTSYVGFTSATGSLGGQTKILSWNYGSGY
jgi:Legume lectin domain